MFLIEKDTAITPTKILDFINKYHNGEKSKLQRYYDYYTGKQDILFKPKVAKDRPCNRVVANYCLAIVNNYNGYLTGKDITYSSSCDFSSIQNVLNYNDVQQADNQLLKNALIYGVAYEICYIDEDGKQRFKVLDSRECFPIYDNTLNQDLMAVVRYYPIDNYNLSKGYYVEVYDKSNVYVYKTTDTFSSMTLINQKPHYYNMVPITVFYLNEEKRSIFDSIMDLQDAYNKLVSAEIDSFEEFAEAYMIIKGIYIDEDQLEDFRTKRLINVIGDGSGSEVDVSYLTKNINDTQIENILTNINNMIHKIANSPDFTQENFGTSSGIALRYRLLGFENISSAIEKQMTKAIQRRLELICSILNLTGEESIWRDVQIQFKRNLPIDLADIINSVNGLRGLVSDKTLLSQIPFVQDIEEEITLINAQKQENATIYSFTPVEEDDE